MNKENKEKISIIPIILLIVIYGIPIGAIFFMNYIQDTAEIDELHNVIDNRYNVSKEYVQGWNDCINYLIHIRTRATNMTAADIK
jgi:flagellar basal body-associated protein FliL